MADYHIRRVEASPFARPIRTLKEIHGETTMGWTAFVVEIDDDMRFSYGTSFSFEFFDLPKGYSYSNIRSVHSGMVQLDREGTIPFSLNHFKQVTWLREKPFFTCYLDGL